MRDFFASDPDAAKSLGPQFPALSGDPDAPQFAKVRINENADGSAQWIDNDEMRALKVRMQIYLLEHAPLDKGRTALFNTHPTPEEAKILAAAREERASKDRAVPPFER